MDTLLHQNCPCWRLTEPLSGDDKLPSHICPDTMRGTVHAAIRDGVLPEYKWWPARAPGDDPVGSLTVLFVLRQWAEDGPSEALAQLLARQYGWGQLVLEIRAGPDWRLNDDAGLAGRLRDFGLPETPGTIRHLRAEAAGDPRRHLPTRGVLVTTIARTLPPHDFTVSGTLDTTTAALFEQAVAPIVARHLAFAAEVVGRHHASNLRRAALDAGRPEPAAVDYAEAAWGDRDDLLLMRQAHPNGIEGAITDYLDMTGNRVGERRKRAGLPRKPPAGWRDASRQRLRDWLLAES